MARIDIPEISSDVLVIGGGLAGCWASLKASESGSNVVLVDSGIVSKSGKSSRSGASILYPKPEDDLSAWHKEMVRRGDYVNDQDWVTAILQEIRPRIEEMDAMGIEFERDKRGAILASIGIAHGITRVTNVSSSSMMSVLKKNLLNRRVRLVEQTTVIGLLTEDGLSPTRNRVVGSLGYNMTSKSPVIFNAGSVIVAMGGTGPFDLTGDGIALAFQTGADIVNMDLSRMWSVEFVEKHKAKETAKISGPTYPVEQIHLNTWQRIGMHLLNSKGERFMERYEPEQMERSDRKQLGPAIATEYLEGRGPVYLDVTHIGKEELDKLRGLFTTTQQIKIIESDGIDFTKDKLKVHTTTTRIDISTGGIKHNLFCESSIPGLFVAGEAGGYPGHGTYSVGGVNLAHCCVEGYRAGEFASRYAREMGRSSYRKQQVEALTQKVSSSLVGKTSKSPNEFKKEITSFVGATDISLFRTAKSLKKALKKTRGFQEECSSLKGRDLADVMRFLKIQNYLLCAQIIFETELIRDESRGCHIRMDFPIRDNKHWLKWIVAKSSKDDNRIAIDTVPVPIYRFPIRPEKYEQEPYPMPLPEAENIGPLQ